MTMDQEKAKKLIQEQINFISILRSKTPWNRHYDIWVDKTKDILEKIFGKKSQFNLFENTLKGPEKIAKSTPGRIRIDVDINSEKSKERYDKCLDELEGLLTDYIVIDIPLILESSDNKSKSLQIKDEEKNEKPKSNKIFIVHGKDEENKKALKEMLLQWRLNPIILAEEPNRGRTLIEKLLDQTSEVEYVFVLMTPDDVGASTREFIEFANHVQSIIDRATKSVKYILEKIKNKDFNKIVDEDFQKDFYFLLGKFEQESKKIKRRARQNVIFEYGLCVGSLGREKVCLLVKGDVDLPSDVYGYGYTDFKNDITERKEEIKQELEAIGYELSVRKIIWNFVPPQTFVIMTDKDFEVEEVPDEELPPEILTEKKRLSKNAPTPARVYKIDDTYSIYYTYT